jgi:hypothetical protein
MRIMTEVIAAQETADMADALAADIDLQAEQQTAFETRWGGVEDVRTLKSVQVHLPQGADEAAFATLERLRDLERRYAAPNLLTADYDLGVAEVDDEIRIISGAGALVTAEHATNPYRKKTGLREAADQGTAALAAAMAEDGLAESLIMTGRQMGNAGVTPDHPIKWAALQQLNPALHGFLSVHSKLPGQAPGLMDTSEVHAYIGLGRYEPRESTLLAAEQIIQAANDLGLRAMIGNNTYHPIYQKDPSWQAPGPMRDRLNRLSLGEDGMPRMSRLAGFSAESTTSWMNVHTDATRYSEMPILQMEIANSLCVTAEDRYARDPKALAMGVHLGYLLTQAATEIIGRGGALPEADII